MKKISLLIALCMLLTVGGVYATWIYSGTSLDVQTESFISALGGLQHEGSSGLYSFTNNTLKFAVEPDNQQDKNATIVWDETTSITVVFTPHGDISTQGLATALNATFTIISNTLGTYNGADIYSINPDFAIVVTPDNWTGYGAQNADGVYESYTYTITATALKEANPISIADISLPTEDDYNDFNAANGNVKFKIQVSPQVTAPAVPQA